MRTSDSTLIATHGWTSVLVRLSAAVVSLVLVWACTDGASNPGGEDEGPALCESNFDCPIAWSCTSGGVCELDDSDVDPLPLDAGSDAEADADVDPLRATWGVLSLSSGPWGRNNAHAWCSSANVVTDDLTERWYDDFYPAEGFGRAVVDDEPGRCGDDAETLGWRLANCERMSRDLAPLACDVRAVWLGRMHSADMIARNFFLHDNPDLQSPFDRMEARQVLYRAAGENIAQGQRNAEEAHVSWMNSDGHRQNILGTSFTHTGLGIVESGGRFWYTASFITPR